VSNWKPGDILAWQYGGFSGDYSVVIVLETDPWECVGIDGDTKYVPDSPERNLSPVKKLRAECQRTAATTLHAHGFYDQAFDLMLTYANELEAEVKGNLEGAQQANRAQVAHINLCHAEINKLKDENEKLTRRIEELTK
jgi:hypothetical protein